LRAIRFLLAENPDNGQTKIPLGFGSQRDALTNCRYQMVENFKGSQSHDYGFDPCVYALLGKRPDLPS
jgi:hypothetical protein